MSQESALSDIFSWSTSLETKVRAPTSSLQAIPIDIRASFDFDDDGMSYIVPSTMSSNLDPNIEFDWSCLDGLDAQLLHFPVDAFAATCWMGATGTTPTHLTGISDLASRTRSRKEDTHEDTSSGSSSDESEWESDESRIPDDHLATVFVPEALDSDSAFGNRPVSPMVSNSC